jgi:hypothetical protein
VTCGASGPFDSELEARAAAKRWSDPSVGLDPASSYELGHDTEARRAGMRDVRKQRLWEAFTRTGLKTGRYDNEVVVWVDGWEIASVEVVASLIERAYEAGLGQRTADSPDTP